MPQAIYEFLVTIMKNSNWTIYFLYKCHTSLYCAIQKNIMITVEIA